MRCQTCDYPLWNLKARHCPECGGAFQPSEFEFRPNSVRFCCPHCDQAYYGTGHKGRLVPRQFQCVSCQQTVDMDEMVLRPAVGVAEEHTVVDGLPWPRRKTAGWFKCWWQTTWRGMVGPVRLAQSMAPNATAGQAWWYALVTLFVVWFTGISLPFGVIAIAQGISGGTIAAEMALYALGGAIVLTAGSLLGILIWGLITHGVLLITGGCTKSLGFTFQALCYTAGANVFIAIPCAGPYCMTYVSLVWWIVSAVLMVAALQRVHGGRASLATLTFPVLTILVIVGFYGWFFYWAMNTNISAAVRAQQFAPTGQTTMMNDALRSWAGIHNGELPEHALAMVRDGSITPDDFIANISTTTLSDVPLAGTDLFSFSIATGLEQTDVIDSMIADQPANVVAHRVGDFVFTYHGIDPAGDTPGLWLVLLIDDPDAGNTMVVGTQVFAGLADGSVQQFAIETMPTELDAQNQLRADAGLPALPDDLAAITHDEPVVEQ